MHNPGKHCFIKIGAEIVRPACEKTENNGVKYARKEMIICGLSLDTRGVWHVGKLKAELRAMIGWHQTLFYKIFQRSYVNNGASKEEKRETKREK